MKRIHTSSGFTLIELLVVIAIIGILSEVVLASLNSARAKGNDAAIKSDLDGIRTQSGVYYDTNQGFSLGTSAVTAAAGTAAGCYAPENTFFNDAKVAEAIVAADKAAGGAAIPGGTTMVTCAIDAADIGNKSVAWSVTAPLTVPGAGYWCVDSQNHSTHEDNPVTTTACP